MTEPSTVQSLAMTRPSSAIATDERITHRGPMQRWLISPEIGALIGAVIVWAFFWANSRTFGEADSTLNWLDVAAPLGIMAVAVSLLMIGGEFDLSSGVMTGATAVLIGLLTTYFMGEGINIGWAILAAFIAASAIGWFNGFMVNKTGLPSFIVTLASFFVLRGVILVMSKRLAGKVQVADILRQPGSCGVDYDPIRNPGQKCFYKDWIAHEWKFTEFAGRDPLFVTLVLVGAALFTYGLLEQSFVRRKGIVNGYLIGALMGAIAAIGGFVALLNTEGVGANVLWGAIAGGGAVLMVVGVASTRWVTRHEGLRHPIGKDVLGRVGLGLAAIALTCVVPVPFDRSQAAPTLSWTSSGLRPVVAALAAAIGIALAVRSMLPTIRARSWKREWPKVVFFAAYSGAVAMVLTLSFLQLATVQAVRAISMLLLASLGLGVMLNARGRAAKLNRSWQLYIGLITAAAMTVLAFAIRNDSGAPRFRTGMFSAVMIGVVVIVANTVLEFVMDKRRVPDEKADKFGRRLQLAGFLLAFTGMVIRLVWSNLTPEHAARVKAAGGDVGQNVLRQPVLWWLLIAIVGGFILTKSKYGNWIFAVGGNPVAARNIGVPVEKVKIALFVAVSLCAALSGTLIALRYGTVQANTGTGLEFEYIIAAVVGGSLMTGGYGSVIGASLGAAIMAMSKLGVQTTGWNDDGRYAFLGGVLLLAVLVNNYTRKKAQEAR